MKNLIGIILLLFFLVPQSDAQNNDLDKWELENFDFTLTNSVTRVSQMNSYKGSPYFNDWREGHLMINEGTNTKPLLFRFDMEQNIVVFQRNNELYGIPEENLKGFVLYNNTGPDLLFKNGFNINDEDIGGSTMLHVIYNGETKLLAHHNAELVELIGTYGSATKEYEFVADTKYFLQKTDGSVRDIKKLKRKHILSALEDEEREDELKNYAAQNNLSFEKELEVRKILSHYDKLIKE